MTVAFINLIQSRPLALNRRIQRLGWWVLRLEQLPRRCTGAIIAPDRIATDVERHTEYNVQHLEQGATRRSFTGWRFSVWGFKADEVFAIDAKRWRLDGLIWFD